MKKIRDKLLVERNDTNNLYNKIPIKVNRIEQIKKRDELEKKLAQINNDLGTTIIMATHDKDIVNKMKKRVVVINKGLVAKDTLKGKYVNEGI